MTQGQAVNQESVVVDKVGRLWFGNNSALLGAFTIPNSTQTNLELRVEADIKNQVQL